MAQVTDPSVLEKLNAGNPAAAPTTTTKAKTGAPSVGGKVTDPKLIEQLESAETPSFFDRAKSFVTGEGRREFDLPELGTSGPSVPAFSQEGMRMLGAYAFSADPQQIADIAVKTLPGATKKEDKHGNPIITFEGQDYYVNRPGASEADAFQFLSQMGMFAPAARFGAAGGGLVSRMARTGAASATTSAASDVASEELGSEQGVSGERAVLAGLTGGLFEGLAPIAVKAWRTLLNRPGLFDAARGGLTPKGEEAARAAGLNIEDMSERLAREFGEQATDAADPKAAARAAQAQEFDIPLTRGQTSKDFAQLAKEEAMRHDAYGEKAGGIVRRFDERQTERVGAASDRVQETLGGGQRTVAKEQQAGDMVAEGLEIRLGRINQQIDDAYEAARATDARVSTGSLKDLSIGIRESLSEFDIDPQLMPATTRALRNVGNLGRELKGGKVTEVSLRRLETERRKLNNLIDASANKADRKAVLKIKDTLDRWLDDAFDNALFSGDKEALNLLKNARYLRKEKGRMFEPSGRKDEAGKVIQKMIERDPTPEQVINWTFGRSTFGGPEVSTRVVGRLKSVLGEESVEMDALRQAGWLRLSRDKTGNHLTPKRLANSIDEALNKNESLLNELYTPEQVSLMKRYRDAVMETVMPEGVRNPSKTGFTLARLARDFTRRLGTMATFSGNPGLGAGLFTLARAPTLFKGRAALNAVTPTPPQLPRSPALVSGGQAGTRGAQE